MRSYSDEELRERGFRPDKGSWRDMAEFIWAPEQVDRVAAMLDATHNAAIEAAASLFDLFVSVLRDNEQHVCAHRVEAQIKTIRQLRRPE